MFFKFKTKFKTKTQREKIKRGLKVFLAIVAIIFGMALISYLFLSGFNYLEEFLGWKKNIIAGLITGLMAGFILLDVLVRYLSRSGRYKFYDKLSIGVYTFLFISLLMAFFINFGTCTGILFMLLTGLETAGVWWRQASMSKRKKFKRSLPWIFYR